LRQAAFAGDIMQPDFEQPRDAVSDRPISFAVDDIAPAYEELTLRGE
jgi:hypothetical protein